MHIQKQNCDSLMSNISTQNSINGWKEYQAGKLRKSMNTSV